MKEISPIGWVLIGVITLIVFSSYWSLASMLRKRSNNPNQPSWTKSWRTLTNPWEGENHQMDKLSKEVKELGLAPKEDQPKP